MSTDHELVPTGSAARQIGVHRGTLVRWWRQGVVTPELTTPGGQARWDVARLKRQLGELRQAGE